ncbi:MAG: ATP-binding cassette domain-containing protein [Alphaproteobacteria bacterium]|nr:MAG: ATP-binding cassette domain-containing protein [Alphaproteobacteria bacterium]
MYAVTDIVREFIPSSSPEKTELRKDEFWANQGISFDVHEGDSLALVGHNGAGKSTLLKMINGLIKPDIGSIEIRGRVGALIELGAGFNPVLTGRENIFINAAVLGIPKREVKQRLDAIIDFAEIGDFLDMPLKSYSSGMRIRLGFAVAAQLEPDILLIDEVLAVGDTAFRAKCYRRLSELQRNGTAFILVSHNHHTLLTVCNKAVGLENGKMIAKGTVSSVLDTYETRLAEYTTGPDNAPKGKGRGKVRITKVGFRDSKSEPITSPRTGEAVEICLSLEAKERIESVSMDVIVRASGVESSTLLAITAKQDCKLQDIPAGRSEYRLRLDPLGLVPGQYVAKVSVNRPPLETFDIVEGIDFLVLPGATCGDSAYYNPRTWLVVAESNEPRLENQL